MTVSFYAMLPEIGQILCLGSNLSSDLSFLSGSFVLVDNTFGSRLVNGLVCSLQDSFVSSTVSSSSVNSLQSSLQLTLEHSVLQSLGIRNLFPCLRVL